MGLTYEQYWSDTMTPNLLVKYANAYARKRQSELEMIDATNHQLGRYIAFAFHAPDKYPKNPAMSDTADSSRVAPRDFRQQAKQKYSKKE